MRCLTPTANHEQKEHLSDANTNKPQVNSIADRQNFLACCSAISHMNHMSTFVPDVCAGIMASKLANSTLLLHTVR